MRRVRQLALRPSALTVTCEAVAVVVVVASSAMASAQSRWLQVKALSSIGASGVRVAMDGRGDATIAWAQDVGTGYGVVEAAYRPAGGPFRSSRVVSGRGLWAGPDLAVDAAGEATLVWAAGNPPNVTVQVATRAAKARSFGTPTMLDGPHDLVFSPKIAVDTGGDAVAAWLETDDAVSTCCTCCRHFVLRAAFRPAGGSFGAPTSVFAFDVDSAPEFELGVGSAGDSALVLATDRHPNSAVVAFYRRAGGAFGRPRVLAVASDEATPTTDVNFVEAPEVAVGAHGDVLAAWAALGPVVEVRASYRSAKGMWQASEPVADGSGAYRVAFDGHGRATAAWIDANGTVRLRSRSSEGAWVRSPALSPIGDRTSVVPPAVAVGSSGDVVVAWANLTPAVPAVSAIVRERDGTFTPVRAVSNGPGFPLNPVQLAVDAHGNAVASWQTARSVQPIDTGPNGQWIEAAAYEAK